MNSLMEGKIIFGAANKFRNQSLRLIVTKASNRAALPGVRLLVTKTINKEEVDMDIDIEKEKKTDKRQQVKKMVDSKINKSGVCNDDPDS